jgi:DNA polymerase
MPEDSLEAIAAEVIECRKCRLCETRKNAVPGEGSKFGKVVFVGEAPGEQENNQGLPFVGAAGKLLTELLQSVRLGREEVFITNIVKCRPPNNRPPRKDEVAACSSYLERQLKLLRPRVICPMGNSAIHTLISPDSSVSELHGVATKKDCVMYFPMYHPAAALYTFALREVMREDFRKLKSVLDLLG